MDKFYRTRFDDGEQRLLFAHIEGTQVGYGGLPRKVSFWSFFHQHGTDRPSKTGPEFPARESLLAAAEQFGRDYGFN